jgi:ABC-type Fe3+ transport system permease subunit
LVKVMRHVVSVLLVLAVVCFVSYFPLRSFFGDEGNQKNTLAIGSWVIWISPGIVIGLGIFFVLLAGLIQGVSMLTGLVKR